MTRLTQALIPAAGRGLRAYPKTHYVPKVMLESPASRSSSATSRSCATRSASTIDRHRRPPRRPALRPLRQRPPFGVRVRYVEYPDPERGLGTALLGDDPHRALPDGPRRRALPQLEPPGARRLWRPAYDAVCSVTGRRPRPDQAELRRQLEDGRITRLVQKPPHRNASSAAAPSCSRPPSSRDRANAALAPLGAVELPDTITNPPAAAGRAVRAHRRLPEHQHHRGPQPRELPRPHHAFPRLYGDRRHPGLERGGILAYVVRDFRASGRGVRRRQLRSRDGTAEARARGRRARRDRPLSGYGDAIRQGLDHATGDILVVVEADCTFRARDLGSSSST